MAQKTNNQKTDNEPKVVLHFCIDRIVLDKCEDVNEQKMSSVD